VPTRSRQECGSYAGWEVVLPVRRARACRPYRTARGGLLLGVRCEHRREGGFCLTGNWLGRMCLVTDASGEERRVRGRLRPVGDWPGSTLIQS